MMPMKIVMDWKTLLFAAVAVLAAALLAARSCRSEEDRIRDRFEQLCDLNSLSGTETTLAAGVRAKEVGEFFSPRLEIDAESVPISIDSLQELRQIVFKARTNMNRIDVDPRKVEVNLAPNNESAAMTVSVRISANGRGERVSFDEAFTIDWTKQSGEWIILSIEHYETIRLVD